MSERTVKWLAVIASLGFVAWLLATPREALRICEEEHSTDTCIQTLR